MGYKSNDEKPTFRKGAIVSYDYELGKRFKIIGWLHDLNGTIRYTLKYTPKNETVYEETTLFGCRGKDISKYVEPSKEVK